MPLYYPAFCPVFDVLNVFLHLSGYEATPPKPPSQRRKKLTVRFENRCQVTGQGQHNIDSLVNLVSVGFDIFLVRFGNTATSREVEYVFDFRY